MSPSSLIPHVNTTKIWIRYTTIHGSDLVVEIGSLEFIMPAADKYTPIYPSEGGPYTKDSTTTPIYRSTEGLIVGNTLEGCGLGIHGLFAPL